MAAAEMNVGVTFDGFAMVRPGDTLVVALNGPVTHETAAWYKAKLLEQLPGLANIVVIADAVGLVAYRPDDGPPDAR